MLSCLLGDQTMRGVGFSFISATTGRGLASVSDLFCRAFWDLELRFPTFLERILSLLSGFDLPTNVTVGRRGSTGEFSLLIAIFAAS